MATITLKGNNEPIITDYDTAKKVREWWFDNSTPMTAKTDIGHLSCLKSEIKQINLSAMADRNSKEEHWIIYSPKRNSIWQGTYPTYELAQKEYNRQMEMLHPESREGQDWVIEKHGGWNNQTKKVEEKKNENWGGF